MGSSCYLLSAWLVLMGVITLATPHPHPIQESDSGEIPQRLRELLLIRRLISTLNAAESDDVALPYGQQQPMMRKRTCYLNAGLSHGCDYKDLVGATAEKNYWDSLSSPGRKKRSVPEPRLASLQLSHQMQ
uniref:Diuretic hormone 31 n=1 Tax=Nephrops norvegicus TaxID=6829 RepID=A0A4D6BPY5_NEPNO|nr:diuretic hormone 31 [Nephrops norvegicus]